MSNIFTKMKDYVEKPNRNTFDLSFQNNLTMEFGKLYPVFCKEVIPGDSFRIKPTFGLRFMPLVFPVQTRMQANLHFFYVRNRNLWKDWTDFIGRTKKDLVLPFLSPAVAKKVCKTCGLGDYLGVPTTIVGNYGSVWQLSDADILYPMSGYVNTFTNYAMSSAESGTDAWAHGLSLTTIQANTTGNTDLAFRTGGSIANTSLDLGAIREIDGKRVLVINTLSKATSTNAATNFRLDFLTPYDDNDYRDTANLAHTDSGVQAERFAFLVTKDNVSGDVLTCYYGSAVAEGHECDAIKVTVTGDPVVSGAANMWQVPVRLEIDLAALRFIWIDFSASPAATHSGDLSAFVEGLKTLYGTSEVLISYRMAYPSKRNYGQWSNQFFGAISFEAQVGSSANRDITSYSSVYNPYENGDLKISALPFRAYESIYNAFYRNQFNDPFTINGVKEFNRFITTDEGGEDSTDYDLCKRNYEQDFLTSAKQSPVDGDITPLVGVSGTGTFTFQNADGTQVNITPKYAADGTTIIGLETVEGTPENTSSIRRMMDMASVGISINDFRNVNALQRWLETNLRRGYRYKDQLLSHFGVEAKFDVLDMPEFIGGMSEPVMVNQINQSVDQTGDPSGMGDFSKVLGSYAGQASVLAQSKHDVEKYCDEHGFIIGILSISPVPNYSQLLPKFFLKNNVLDYYFPEFGHIGNQPIPYSEVCPLQSYIAGDPLTDVFGYNRAWYDYLASVDEVHGDFRLSLEGFLINRVFDSRPELGKDFLEVDPDVMSNPFSVTEDVDKILGQVYFEVTAQRPIPKFGIPRLE